MFRSFLGVMVLVAALLACADRRADLGGTASRSQGAGASVGLDRQAAADRAAHVLSAPADSFQSTTVKLGPAPQSPAARRVSFGTARARPPAPISPLAFPPFRSTPLLI